jgi:hypothetical protein
MPLAVLIRAMRATIDDDVIDKPGKYLVVGGDEAATSANPSSAQLHSLQPREDDTGWSFMSS